MFCFFSPIHQAPALKRKGHLYGPKPSHPDGMPEEAVCITKRCIEKVERDWILPWLSHQSRCTSHIAQFIFRIGFNMTWFRYTPSFMATLEFSNMATPSGVNQCRQFHSSPPTFGAHSYNEDHVILNFYVQHKRHKIQTPHQKSLLSPHPSPKLVSTTLLTRVS